MLGTLGWEEWVSWRCEAREAGAESRLRHTIVLGRCSTLGEESLRRP